MDEHVERFPIGVGALEGAHPDEQLDLFGVVLAGDLVGVARTRSASLGPETAIAESGETLRHQLDDPIVVDRTGDRDHGGGSAVVGAVEVADIGRADGLDRRPLPCRLAPERMLGVQRLGQQPIRDIVGLVVVHGQFFQDHLAFDLDVGVPQRGAGHHLAEQVDTELDPSGGNRQ